MNFFRPKIRSSFGLLNQKLQKKQTQSTCSRKKATIETEWLGEKKILPWAQWHKRCLDYFIPASVNLILHYNFEFPCNKTFFGCFNKWGKMQTQTDFLFLWSSQPTFNFSEQRIPFLGPTFHILHLVLFNIAPSSLFSVPFVLKKSSERLDMYIDIDYKNIGW